MNKLSFNDFKEKTNLIANENLLNTISGGLENACHDKILVPPVIHVPIDNTGVKKPIIR